MVGLSVRFNMVLVTEGLGYLSLTHTHTHTHTHAHAHARTQLLILQENWTGTSSLI